MDKLNAMSAFVNVVEQQSFTKAAQILNLPRSTLTDAIKQLEFQLNTRLLLRTTRQVKATDEGHIYMVNYGLKKTAIFQYRVQLKRVVVSMKCFVMLKNLRFKHNA